jgi:hypothetical protein
VDACPRCRKIVGQLGHGIATGSGLYNCLHCGAPLSGHPFSPNSHERFRANPAALRAFDGLQGWLAGGPGARLHHVSQLVAQNSINDWATWCDNRSMLLDIVRKLLPNAPEALLNRSARKLSVLRWSIRLTSSRFAAGDYVHHRRRSLTTEKLVYAATLDALHRWAFGGASGTAAARDMLMLTEKGVIHAEGRDLRQLALAFFRLRFERPPSTPFGWIDPRRAEWKGPLDARHIGAYAPKLPMRAILLGTFSLVFEIVRSLVAQSGVLDVRGVQTRVVSCVPLVYLPAFTLPVINGDISEGFVIFPSLPDFDLRKVWAGTVE